MYDAKTCYIFSSRILTCVASPSDVVATTNSIIASISRHGIIFDVRRGGGQNRFPYNAITVQRQNPFKLGIQAPVIPHHNYLIHHMEKGRASEHIKQ
jgi:hypothetical protein